MKIPAFETLISSKYFGINKVENHTQRDTLTYANRAQIAYALIKDAIYDKEHPKDDKESSQREAEEQVNNLVDTLLQDFKNSVSNTERPTMGDTGEIAPSYFAFSDANPYGEIMNEEMYVKSQDPATNLFTSSEASANPVAPEDNSKAEQQITSMIQETESNAPVQEAAAVTNLQELSPSAGIQDNPSSVTLQGAPTAQQNNVATPPPADNSGVISINPITPDNMSQFKGDGLDTNNNQN